MARTGRPAATIPRVYAKIALLPEHHSLLELLDQDLFRTKRVYGARNQHFDIALREYFEKYYPEFVNKPIDSKKESA